MLATVSFDAGVSAISVLLLTKPFILTSLMMGTSSLFVPCVSGSPFYYFDCAKAFFIFENVDGIGVLLHSSGRSSQVSAKCGTVQSYIDLYHLLPCCRYPCPVKISTPRFGQLLNEAVPNVSSS